MLVNGRRWLDEAEPFGDVLAWFHPIAEAWLSWIDPGGYIVAHRDGGPYRERWQVPLRTSGYWGRGTFHNVGEPFKVVHWEPHSVTNNGNRPRVHLVIDRDLIVNPDPTPFTIEESHG